MSLDTEAFLRQLLEPELTENKFTGDRQRRWRLTARGKDQNARSRGRAGSKAGGGGTRVRRDASAEEDVLEAPVRGGLLSGHHPTAVLRWMGQQGFSVKEAQAALQEMGVEVSEATVKTQVAAGKRGQRGEPAALTPEQQDALNSYRVGGGPRPAPPPPSPPAPPAPAPPKPAPPPKPKPTKPSAEREAAALRFSPEQVQAAKQRLQSLPAIPKEDKHFGDPREEIDLRDVGFQSGVAKGFATPSVEKYWDVQEIDPSKIRPVQKSVLRDEVAKKLDGQLVSDYSQGDLPDLVKEGDIYYLQGGNHRAVAQVLARAIGCDHRSCRMEGMTSDLRPYPEYKDSGLPWLGRVPAHWDVRRAKYLFRCVDVRSTTGEEELLTVSAERGVVPRSSMKVTMFKAESYVGHKLCWPNDLVINSIWAWGRGLGVTKQHGIISSAYGVYRLRPDYEYLADYIHHLVRSSAFHWELRVRSKGVWISRLQLTDDAFLDAPIPMPPPEEAEAVVHFIQLIDRRVNRFIRNRRRLIEVLNEQKQAIINRAVTRGLDPNAPLKPSGIDWLGDIPAHWEVVALRHLACKFRSGVTPRGGAAVYQEFGVPFLRSQNIHFDGLRLDSVARISRELHESLSATHVQPNDVLLNITGASIGRVCTVPENLIEGNVNQHVCIIRPHRNRIRAAFLAAYLSTGFMQHEIYVAQNGASREGLALDAIRAFKILVPPLEEQERILESITASTSGLIAACARAEREIDLIREYRTRLIADVVTGKVDVRGLALAEPPLDDEQIDEGIDDEEMLGDDEPELVEEAADADD